MIFLDSSEFAVTFLKMSNAKVFPDCIREACSSVRFIGTGSLGRFSITSFLQEANKQKNVNDKNNNFPVWLFFIMSWLC
jgi:DNA primase large subunit